MCFFVKSSNKWGLPGCFLTKPRKTPCVIPAYNDISPISARYTNSIHPVHKWQQDIHCIQLHIDYAT